MSTIPVITDEADVPTGDQYAYHVTPRRHRDGIRQRGLRPMDRGPSGNEIDDLIQPYRQGADRPHHRGDCVFLHPTRNRVRALGGEESELNVTFVVDLHRVSVPVYTADFHGITDLYHGSRDDERVARIAREYWDSCRSFTPGDTPESELLVEGTVPPTALTHEFDPHAD